MKFIFFRVSSLLNPRTNGVTAIIQEFNRMSRPIKVGILSHPPRISHCAVHLAKLHETRDCGDLGLTADVLGKALAIARIPYTLVPLEFDGNIGSYDADSSDR